MIPNGCEAEHFATADRASPPQDVHLEGPVAGFIGHMSERIDLAMLEAVASSGVSLLLVGPRQKTFEIAKLDRLLALPNVQWVGPKEFEELPSYLRVIDVGLTPYSQSDFNRASFPLKTLEYLAAGRPSRRQRPAGKPMARHVTREHRRGRRVSSPSGPFHCSGLSDLSGRRALDGLSVRVTLGRREPRRSAGCSA